MQRNGNPAELVITREITVDVELHIRHGTSLILRNVRWLVTDQLVGESLLGRPILEALGMDTSEILSGAAEKHYNSILFDTTFSCDQSGCSSRVLEGVYNADGGADDNDLDDGWIDIGPEDLTEKETII